MTHLIKPINLELIIKLTAGTLLSATIIATGANAINTGIEAEDSLHLEHKLWLEENSGGGGGGGGGSQLVPTPSILASKQKTTCIIEHKLWLEENSNSVYDNDISLDEYEASQRAKEIADANASLAKIKAYADGGSK